MTAPTPEHWLDQYRALCKVKQELREFMCEREQVLFPIAAKYVNSAYHADAVNPCGECTINSVGTVADERMYFEWSCRNPWGRCSADTCGWWVKLKDLERELALADLLES